MCKLSNLYVLDLWSNNVSGDITFNVANSLPQLMNQPCKIKVKQVQSELVDAGLATVVGPPEVVTNPSSIDKYLYLRVVHNMNIQSGSNREGFSNSNILCLFDTYKGRQTFIAGAAFGDATSLSNAATGTTETDCTLFAPNGLPAILTLQRWGTDNTTLVDAQRDLVRLSWIVRLEITVNPDQE